MTVNLGQDSALVVVPTKEFIKTPAKKLTSRTPPPRPAPKVKIAKPKLRQLPPWNSNFSGGEELESEMVMGGGFQSVPVPEEDNSNFFVACSAENCNELHAASPGEGDLVLCGHDGPDGTGDDQCQTCQSCISPCAANQHPHQHDDLLAPYLCDQHAQKDGTTYDGDFVPTGEGDRWEYDNRNKGDHLWVMHDPARSDWDTTNKDDFVEKEVAERDPNYKHKNTKDSVVFGREYYKPQTSYDAEFIGKEGDRDKTDYKKKNNVDHLQGAYDGPMERRKSDYGCWDIVNDPRARDANKYRAERTKVKLGGDSHSPHRQFDYGNFDHRAPERVGKWKNRSHVVLGCDDDGMRRYRYDEPCDDDQARRNREEAERNKAKSKGKTVLGGDPIKYGTSYVRDYPEKELPAKKKCSCSNCPGCHTQKKKVCTACPKDRKANLDADNGKKHYHVRQVPRSMKANLQSASGCGPSCRRVGPHYHFLTGADVRSGNIKMMDVHGGEESAQRLNGGNRGAYFEVDAEKNSNGAMSSNWTFANGPSEKRNNLRSFGGDAGKNRNRAMSTNWSFVNDKPTEGNRQRTYGEEFGRNRNHSTNWSFGGDGPRERDLVPQRSMGKDGGQSRNLSTNWSFGLDRTDERNQQRSFENDDGRRRNLSTNWSFGPGNYHTDEKNQQTSRQTDNGQSRDQSNTGSFGNDRLDGTVHRKSSGLDAGRNRNRAMSTSWSIAADSPAEMNRQSSLDDDAWRNRSRTMSTNWSFGGMMANDDELRFKPDHRPKSMRSRYHTTSQIVF